MYKKAAASMVPLSVHSTAFSFEGDIVQLSLRYSSCNSDDPWQLPSVTSNLQLLRSTKAPIKRHSVSIAAKPATIWDLATIQTRPLLMNWPPDPRPLFEPGLYTGKYSR